MFERIILLADPTEQSFLIPILAAENPELDIRAVSTLDALRAIEAREFRHARLIAFVTTVVVPIDVLHVIGHGAFNFHPGPPDYPGWAPAHFALYDRAKVFGVTLHAMVGLVDAGPILDIDMFPIPSGATVVTVESAAYSRLAMMFHRWAGALTHDAPVQARFAARWSARKNSRRSYRAMCNIPTDISRDDLAHRISIFGHGHFGILPSVSLHGVEFTASPRDETTEPASIT
jgi:methionyl-tRNA formyltransferase